MREIIQQEFGIARFFCWRVSGRIAYEKTPLCLTAVIVA